MASKPTILLIPGSFTTAPMYYPLQDTLAAQGYETYINSLPSASRNAPEPPATLGDDASFFSNIIGTIADQGKDIIVLGHSYGGMVACESAKGQSKIERRARGQDGGIVRIIFLSAIVLPEGQSVAAHQGEPPASIVTKDEYGYMRLANPAFTASRMFDTWPEERALAWAKASSRHSALSFASALTHAAYKNIPSSYIFCEHDQILPPVVQEQYIDNIRVATGREVDIHKLSTNHAPNLTATEDVAKVILKITAAS